MLKMDENVSLEELAEYVNTHYPEHMIVKVMDVEAPSKDSYKFLYEKTSAELEKFREELFNLQSENQRLESNLAALTSSVKAESNVDKSYAMLSELLEKYSGLIRISDIEARDPEGNKIESRSFNVSDPEELSDRPGVYEFKRPSWYTPLQSELSRNNMAEKNISNTRDTLLKRLLSLKKILATDALAKVADEYDQERRKSVAGIILNSKTNEEKYLKYILVTPGLSKDFQNVLFTASVLGPDPNVVIELLEQPRETFNKEVIESYVSEVRKGTEYNLKQELAEELARGEWYVSVKENGKEKKLQLAPIDELHDIQKNLNTILEMMQSDTGGGNIPVPETLPHEDNDEEIYPYIYDMENDNTEASSVINFDDSML